MKVWLAVYKKNRKTVLHAYPWSFILSRIIGGIFAIIFPLIMYYFVFDKEVSIKFLNYTDNADYITYIVLGQSMNILCFATLMNVGRCLITEIREGTLDTFLLSTASRIQYYIGTYIEQLGRSCMEYAVLLIFGLVIGLKLEMNQLLTYITIFLIASISFFSFSIFVSTLMVYTRDTYLIQNTLILVMECICGVAFPVTFLPNMVQVLANLFPLTPILKIFRACMLLNQSIFTCETWLIQTLILSVMYFTIGYYGFHKLERKLIEEILL